MRSTRIVLVLTAAAALAACGSARDVTSSTSAECTTLPTGSTCVGTPPTYDGFAKGFFDTYCIRCHSTTLVTPEQRHFADPTVNLNTAEGARAVDRCRIDRMAGSGPSQTNTIMPFDIRNEDPTQRFPTVGERVQLSQWLACGTP
jgi:hypothetical protein